MIVSISSNVLQKAISQVNSWVHDWFAELKRRRGNRCEYKDENGRCKEITGLHWAHLRKTGLSGRGRGMYSRMKDVRNYPNCYALLCEFHHRQFDQGEIKINGLVSPSV